MAKTRTVTVKGIHISFTHVILVVVAALLSYIALFLKYPNTWSMILNLLLIGLLVYYLKSENGVIVIILAMLLSILTLPITIISMQVPLLYQIMIFAINAILMILIIFGLKHLTKWGYYLSIAVFAISILSLVATTLTIMSTTGWSGFSVTVLFRQATMIIFYILAVVYLILAHKIFHPKKR
jgi:hypothetical protein